jgi:surfactin synthase thioesterase subunit
LRRLASSPAAVGRLVCFPHAGGWSSNYRRWPSLLPPTVEILAVDYPGRGNRLQDTPAESVFEVATCVAAELRRLPPMPTMFFGHSLGGAVAFQTAHELAATAHTLPLHLAVSARPAPHLPPLLPPIHHLPDADFLRAIGQRYQAVPAELLDHPDVLALLVPALRADVTALERFQGLPASPLPCPITALGGSDDATAPREQLLCWRELTTQSFRLRMFSGGHFYLDRQLPELLGLIAELLEPICGLQPAGAALAQ